MKLVVQVTIGCAAVAGVCVVLAPYLLNWKIRKAVTKLSGPPITNFFLGNVDRIPDDRSKHLDSQMEIIEKYSVNGANYFVMGPIPVIDISGPEYAREILSSSRNLTKGDTYFPLMPWLGTGLLTSTGEKWKSHRRLTTPAFHFEVLQRFLEVMNEQTDVLIERINKQIDKGEESTEIFSLITDCALDIICETAMGKKVNAQGEEGHPDYVEAVYTMSKCIIYRIEHPWLFNDFLFSLTSAGKLHAKNLQILHGFARKVIQERKLWMAQQKRSQDSDSATQKSRPAFLDILLNAEIDGAPLTDEEIREEVDTFMFEGHDTTSASMAWSCHLLGRHVGIQEKCQKEIDDVMGDSTKVTSEIISQLKYLDMVIKESLRVYPSVPTIGRKLTEDVVINGVNIPKGTNIGIVIYALHHNRKYWKDPEVFDPERWNPDTMEERDPYLYVPFSAGSRNCIGQKFAQNEEKVVLAKILRNFRIVSLNPFPPTFPELILRPVEGIHVRLEKRK